MKLCCIVGGYGSQYRHATCVVKGRSHLLNSGMGTKKVLELVCEVVEWRAVVFTAMNCRLTYNMIISTS
jgi:hypothetical protein